MKRLFVFPEIPGTRSGYQIAVASDMKRILQRDSDEVLYYTISKSEETGLKIIPKKSRWSWGRIVNLLKGRVSSELEANELAAQLHKDAGFDICFCGDVIVYRAIKKLYPKTILYVRFHNLFLQSWERNKKMKYKLGLLGYLNIRLLALLEKQIFSDPFVYPIFISKEEARYFHRLYPTRKFKVWEVFKKLNQSETLIYPNVPRLIWFGGVSSHKKFGLSYFINEVYLPLWKRYNQIELHLYGSGTDAFLNEEANIFSHGFYKKAGLPLDGDALFVNPDLLGGGIKLKVKSWMEEGVSFISTSYGMEGYSYTSKNNMIVTEIGEWENEIAKFFKERNLLK